ncbi:hypothetical protein RB195_004705 [Necator americanus]|uniref:Uncharacterized protein n=1 Tax=Necator americanus TaxID=51031 RepID=A0ABR1BJB9_NECAM
MLGYADNEMKNQKKTTTTTTTTTTKKKKTWLHNLYVVYGLRPLHTLSIATWQITISSIAASLSLFPRYQMWKIMPESEGEVYATSLSHL